MSLPFGDVVLDDSGRPLVFASAGIGITPMAGMLSHLVAAGSTCRSGAARRPRRESFALASRCSPTCGPCPTAAARLVRARRARPLPVAGVHAGLMNLAQVDLPADAPYYLCGPLPFMQALRSALLDRGVPPRDIQYEVFGPDLWQADLLTEETPGASEGGRHAA